MKKYYEIDFDNEMSKRDLHGDVCGDYSICIIAFDMEEEAKFPILK